MKKIIAVIGTQSRKATFRAVQEFEKNLKQFEGVDFEYVFLHDYRLEFCRGCKQCFFKGEEFCPAKDDRDKLLAKMEQADGVVWATPAYSFQLSARMKNFFDRLAFICHRPRFFGKVSTAIVVQGFYGGNDILKYLNFTAKALGYRTSKGAVLSTLDPMLLSQEKALSREMGQAAARFYQELHRPLPSPSFFQVMVYYMMRPGVIALGPEKRDYQYYKEKGWFESDYYYQTSLGPIKKLAGKLFEFIGRQMAKAQ